jgi:hypothetical protein
MGLVLRPGNVYMLLELGNGTARRIRYISSLKDTPFIISPLIENTADFAALAQGSSSVQEKRVVRFCFTNAAGEELRVDGDPVITTVKLAADPHPGNVVILRGIPDVFEHPELQKGSRTVVNAHAPALLAYEPERGSIKVCYGIRAGVAWTRNEFDGVRFKASAEGATSLLLDRF